MRPEAVLYTHKQTMHCPWRVFDHGWCCTPPLPSKFVSGCDVSCGRQRDSLLRLFSNSSHHLLLLGSSHRLSYNEFGELEPQKNQIWKIFLPPIFHYVLLSATTPSTHLPTTTTAMPAAGDAHFSRCCHFIHSHASYNRFLIPLRIVDILKTKDIYIFVYNIVLSTASAKYCGFEWQEGKGVTMCARHGPGTIKLSPVVPSNTQTESAKSTI